MLISQADENGSEILEQILAEVSDNSRGLFDWVELILPSAVAVTIVLLGWYWADRTARLQWTRERNAFREEFRAQRQLELDKALWAEEREFWSKSLASVRQLAIDIGRIKLQATREADRTDVGLTEQVTNAAQCATNVIDATYEVRLATFEMRLMTTTNSELDDTVQSLAKHLHDLANSMPRISPGSIPAPGQDDRDEWLSHTTGDLRNRIGQLDVVQLLEYERKMLDLVRAGLQGRTATEA